jgi:hypothetical protein
LQKCCSDSPTAPGPPLRSERKKDTSRIKGMGILWAALRKAGMVKSIAIRGASLYPHLCVFCFHAVNVC